MTRSDGSNCPCGCAREIGRCPDGVSLLNGSWRQRIAARPFRIVNVCTYRIIEKPVKGERTCYIEGTAGDFAETFR